MKPKETAWENFAATGKIEDYLDYCLARKQSLYTMAGGEAGAADATENHRDYPAGFKN